MLTTHASLETLPTPDGGLRLKLTGRLDAAATGAVWKQAQKVLAQRPSPHLLIDASEISTCDSAGIGLLVELGRRQLQAGHRYEITGLSEENQKLLNLFDPADFMDAKPEEPQCCSLPIEIGKASLSFWNHLITLVAFIGELVVALFAAMRHPRKVRWKDAFLIFERAGINALPIITLISFLVGLIMAFQSAIPMRQFGAEIYVANLISLSMLRELGPLMTAIILAGRSGSAFAAELGTMKVNEEIDALTTMGLDPVRFLVVTRLLAALAATPLLTIFAGMVGVIGGSVVLLTMGYPLITYINQVLSAVDITDLLSGLAKTFVFGILIAGIGCLQGLTTRGGASGVGDSATKAVVTGIILIVVTDGIFAVVYYYLGI